MKLFHQKQETNLRELYRISLEQKVDVWMIGEHHGNKESLEFERECISVVKPEVILAECGLDPRTKDNQEIKLVDCDTWRDFAYSGVSVENPSAIREVGMSKCISELIGDSKKPLIVILGDEHVRPESKVYSKIPQARLLIFRPLGITSIIEPDKNGYTILEDDDNFGVIILSYDAIFKT